MIDLTKIDKPFNELDQFTRWAFKGAAYDNKMFQCRDIDELEWETFRSTGVFFSHKIYRLKPEPVIKTHIQPMGAWVLDQHGPIINPSLGDEDGWENGTVTTTTTDGKPTRIVWEATQ
jgi:hypothetical protein